MLLVGVSLIFDFDLLVVNVVKVLIVEELEGEVVGVEEVEEVVVEVGEVEVVGEFE